MPKGSESKKNLRSHEMAKRIRKKVNMIALHKKSNFWRKRITTHAYSKAITCNEVSQVDIIYFYRIASQNG